MGREVEVVGGDGTVVDGVCELCGATVDVAAPALPGEFVDGTDVEGTAVVDVEDDGARVGPVPASDLTPGCSLATTTPIATVAPVAARATERVRRRRRTLARCLDSGELCSWLGFMGGMLSSDWPVSIERLKFIKAAPGFYMLRIGCGLAVGGIPLVCSRLTCWKMARRRAPWAWEVWIEILGTQSPYGSGLTLT